MQNPIEAPAAQSIAQVPQKFNQPPRFMHMKYINLSVVDAAKARLKWVVQNYDDVWVSFSGGKDSLVCLRLMEEVYAELGRTDKINVKFMDEELVCDDIIDFVQEVADSGKYNFKWYCLNMYVGFYVMGKHKPFVTWEKNRVWHRQPPDRDYVVYDIGVDTRDCNENTISKHMYPNDRRTAIILGLRADESMKRFLSVKGGGHNGVPNYMSSDGPNIHVAKPIYDWTELDIFKFFKERGYKYCTFYDQQVWGKAPLRVASALHERGIGQFLKLKQLAPKFYEQLRAVYPEIETHYRYYKEMANDNTMDRYPPTFDGIRQYINEHLDDSHKAEALEFVQRYEVKRRNNLRKEPDVPLGRVSVRQVFALVIGGRFVKGASLIQDISQADIDYEQQHSEG